MSRVAPVVLTTAILLLVVGCGSEKAPAPSSSTVPPVVSITQTAAPCGVACTNKEVTETHCDEGARDAIPGQHIVLDNVRGTLSLRKANPSQCTHIYWTLFKPDKGSDGNFELTLRHNRQASKPQKSEPQNPEEWAWTVGVYGDGGDMMEPCLTVNHETKCLTATSVV